MAPPYTPTARLTDADPPLRQGDPANGDLDRVDRDTRAFVRAALPGELLWRDELEVSPGGAHDAFDVVVGAIAHLVIADGTGELRAVSRAEATLGIGDVEDAPGTLGAAAAPWYVYALRTGGALGFEISDVPPDAARVFRSDGLGSDPTRRYLRTFITDTTGAPIPMRAVRGTCLFRRSAIGSVTGLFAADGLRALKDATVVGRTELNLSERLPPHARVALLQARVVLGASGNGSGAVNLYSADDSTSVALSVTARAAVSGDTAEAASFAEVELTATQRCAYSVTQTTATAVGDIDLMGWRE